MPTHRHTRGHRYTSTTPTKRRFLTITGLFHLVCCERILSGCRLKVPSIRSVLEYLKCAFTMLQYRSRTNYNSSFLILFILFVLAIEFNQRDRLNFWEISFMVYAFGFTLEKIAAMQEHGIKGQNFGLDIIEA